MTEIHKMMFATDFSEISHKALDMARFLKKNLGCSLDVVHVFDPSAFEMPAPYYFMPGVEKWIDDHFSGLKEKGRTALSDLLPGLGDEARTHFIEGKATKELVAFAKKNDIDLIVMGTHGHKGFNHLIMGSVAEHVVRHAHCAVLTVKGEPKQEA